MESSDPIPDLESLLIHNSEMIETMFDMFQDFLIKALIYVDVKYHKIDHATGRIIDERIISFPSRAADIVVDVSSWLEQHVTTLNARIETFNERDSDLQFVGIVMGKIKVTLLQNFGGSGLFPLPKSLLAKKAIINVDTPTECFKYAVLSILHYHEISGHCCRTKSYELWEDELNFDGIEDTENMKLKDIEKFEKLN